MERRRGAQGSGVQPRSGARDLGTNRAAEPGDHGWGRAAEPRVRRGAEPRSLGNPGGAAPRSPGIAGGDAPRSLGDLRGAAPRSPGIAGGAAQRSLGGSRMQPRRGAPGSERSRAAEPGGREWSQQLRLGQEQLKHVSAGRARPPPPGHPGLLCIYNLRPGTSAGHSWAGRWSDLKGLCCTGRGGRVCFSGWVWVPSPREG